MKGIARNLSNIVLDCPLFDGKLKIEETINDKPRQVADFHFCRSQPKVRKHPYVAGLSKSAMELLELGYADCLEDPNTAEYLSGSKLISGSKVVCSNYCGYQFGSWARQLGDGRAHILGSIKTSKNGLQELQLKGSGVSPFSRFADGNSVVSSALRQFIASEAMQAMGVPTTRAGSLVICNEPVKRDPFYNGNIRFENAAIVLRICPSFIRFGTMQLCNSGAPSHKKNPMDNRAFLVPLADHLLQNHYKQLLELESQPYEQLFKEIVRRSALLVAKWQSIGFVHGVLNTDNMSMLGVTIDYGPFGFIDYFSKDFVSNATDEHQRYSYRRQPDVVRWNLQRLAQAMDPLCPHSISQKYINTIFPSTFNTQYDRLMAEKLGIPVGSESCDLTKELLNIMHEFGNNFTNTFTILSQQNLQNSIDSLLAEACPPQVIVRQLRVFPQLLSIPKEHLEHIKDEDPGFNVDFLAEQPERMKIKQFLKNSTPEQYSEHQRQRWQKWLSRYSKQPRDYKLQQRVNPRYVLRNDVVTRIQKDLLELPEKEQPVFLNNILQVFMKPYDLSQWFEDKYWNKKCDPVKLTCSS